MPREMNSSATVTVAIPVYNRLRFIDRALQSVFSQNIPDVDVLVVDNCSTDGTWEALQRYEGRIRLVRNDRNVGLFGNFNRCLALARGTFLRFLCSDDTLVPGCLRREVDVMNANAGVVLLSTWCRQVDEAGCHLGYAANLFPPGIYGGEASIPAVLWCLARCSTNPLNYPSGILLRGSCIPAVGQFDTSFRMTADVEFFLRLLRHGQLGVLDALGCEVTIHTGMESAHLLLDASRDRELHRLLLEYQTMFPTPASFDRAVAELAGHAVAVGVKYPLIGRSAAALAHIRFAHATRLPWQLIARAAAGQAWRRISGRPAWEGGVSLPPAQPLCAS
jgi:glycosyltransferase involved in cell wall biosynthesis